MEFVGEREGGSLLDALRYRKTWSPYTLEIIVNSGEWRTKKDGIP